MTERLEGWDPLGWRAVNSGIGKRIWFIIDARNYAHIQYHVSTNGRLIRFGSPEAANRRAHQLNQEDKKCG